MFTLVIHAPKEKAERENKRSFEQTLISSIGDEYAIPRSSFAKLSTGCKVVLLCKDDKKQAEGKLVELVEKSKTANGIQRYDVHMKDLRLVPYKSEALGRTGIAVIG